MGVYIEDMEMPTSCIACLLNFGEKRPEYGLTIYCPCSDGVISWRDKAFDNGRLASCGIVPVPPHGRLIDADALMHEFEKAQRTMAQHGQEYSCSFMSSSQEISTEWYCVEDMLENAPTILEAEEGE